jgi:hypothetical protein
MTYKTRAHVQICLRPLHPSLVRRWAVGRRRLQKHKATKTKQTRRMHAEDGRQGTTVAMEMMVMV